VGEVHFRNNNENLYESMELFTIVLWRILHGLMEEYTVCSSLDHYGMLLFCSTIHYLSRSPVMFSGLEVDAMVLLLFEKRNTVESRNALSSIKVGITRNHAAPESHVEYYYGLKENTS
jgi:hypothetical protein